MILAVTAGHLIRGIAPVVLLPVIGFSAALTVHYARLKLVGRTLAMFSYGGILSVNAIGILQRWSAPLTWRVPAILAFAAIGVVGIVVINRGHEYY